MDTDSTSTNTIAAQTLARRAQSGLVVAKYSSWCGIFFIFLAGTVGIITQNAKFYLILPVLLFLVISAWLYPVFYRQGRSRFGRVLFMLSMLLVIFVLPLTSSGGLIAAAIGCVVFIVFGYQLLGDSGALWFTLLSIISLAGDFALIEAGNIMIAESPPLVKLVVDPAIMVLLTTLIIRGVLVEQDKLVFKANLARLEMEKQLSAVQTERDWLRQTLTEAEKVAADEQAERDRLQIAFERTQAMTKEMNAVEVLAATIEQTSAARDQAEQIRQASTMMENMWAMVEQSAVHAQTVSNASTRTVAIAQDGRLAVQGIIDSMSDIKTRVQSIEQNIRDLAERTERIGQIITTVNQIANQSNLLALNASIEANRAAEHGEGFAVVAQEMRRMAALSKAATIQVKSILEEVQQATTQTVRATSESAQGIEHDLRLAAEARTAIDRLSQVVDESAQAATLMLDVGRQQMAGVDSVVLAVQNINDTTNQYLSNTQLVEEAVRQMDEVTRRMAEVILLKGNDHD
jgi:methyl-accepting chemotaxis protein